MISVHLTKLTKTNSLISYHGHFSECERFMKVVQGPYARKTAEKKCVHRLAEVVIDLHAPQFKISAKSSAFMMESESGVAVVVTVAVGKECSIVWLINF